MMTCSCTNFNCPICGPRLYPTVEEEREFREAKKKYGFVDHYPSRSRPWGQPYRERSK